MAKEVTAASAITAIHEAAENMKDWDKLEEDALPLGINPTLGGQQGYRSPIDIFYQQVESELDGHIMKAVHACGIGVDKEELLRALKYDRGQYEKGYRDAMDKQKRIPVAERLPTREDATEQGAVLA